MIPVAGGEDVTEVQDKKSDNKCEADTERW